MFVLCISGVGERLVCDALGTHHGSLAVLVLAL
jgi:hypothetical protein